jgi:predicted GNAT family acetyltransferase
MSTAQQTLATIDVDGQQIPVVMNAAAGQIEAHVEQGAALLAYHVNGSVMSIVHTEVPFLARGKGLADALARAALEYARTNGLTVKPYCPFVAGFIQRHRAYADLVEPGFALPESRTD